MICPCGSDEALDSCCGAIISGERPASTAEQLMRSRYTAYSQGNIDYIALSMRGKAAENFNPIDAKTWVSHLKFIQLNIVSSKQGFPQDDIGWVEFEACYKENGKMQKMHELSEFHKIDGQWFYTDGKQLIE